MVQNDRGRRSFGTLQCHFQLIFSALLMRFCGDFDLLGEPCGPGRGRNRGELF